MDGNTSYYFISILIHKLDGVLDVFPLFKFNVKNDKEMLSRTLDQHEYKNSQHTDNQHIKKQNKNL